MVLYVCVLHLKASYYINYNKKSLLLERLDKVVNSISNVDDRFLKVLLSFSFRQIASRLHAACGSVSLPPVGQSSDDILLSFRKYIS